MFFSGGGGRKRAQSMIKKSLKSFRDLLVLYRFGGTVADLSEKYDSNNSRSVNISKFSEEILEFSITAIIIKPRLVLTQMELL